MGALVRLTDWHPRLIALIESRKAQPFAWGRLDCCLWVADAVLAMTGRDPAADVRESYHTARAARSVLRRIGGLAGAGARCGEPVPPLCAGAGDVGIVNDGQGDVLAVCIGDLWIASAKEGLGLIPLEAVRMAWRVA